MGSTSGVDKRSRAESFFGKDPKITRKLNKEPILSRTYLIIAFSFSALLFGFLKLYFGQLTVPFLWLFAGLLVVILFFTALSYAMKRWAFLPTKEFLIRIFMCSLLLRLISMVFLYFIFLNLTGTPFYIQYADEYNYHNFAIDIANAWKSGDLQVTRYIPWGFSYLGYPVFCGLLYLLFGYSTIVARIANCIINSFSVILTYKVSKLIWGERISRVASIIAMLFPWMIFYSALQLKDAVLTFLVLFAIYVLLKLGLGRRMKFWELLLAAITVTIMFTFRTVVGIIAIISTLSYLLFSKSIRINLFKFILGIGLVLGSLLLLVQIGGKEAALNRLVGGYNLADYRASKWATAGSGLSQVASLGLFAVLSLPAPFPTVVDLPVDSSSSFPRPEYYQIGTTLTWNIFSFFALIGIYLSIRYRLRESLPLWIFSLLYLFTLAQSNFIMDERFKLVISPFLIIFIAVGLSEKFRNKTKWWGVYLFFIALVIFGWNYYRLAGRGLL